jgi:CheY-like chemotaxis protein
MVRELKRILVVEDDPVDLELMLRSLKDSNLANAVDRVADGAEALDYLHHRGPFEGRTGEPAVVLLDLKLPKVSGLEVLRAMRADDRLRQIPVVVLTSSREDRDLVDCYAVGVNAYVVKPVDFHQFVDAVRTLGLFWGVINEPPMLTRA